MGRLDKSDANHVRRLRDLLERYRPSARPIIDEFIHELYPVLEADGAFAMRPARGELGWTADFVYSTSPAAVETTRNFLRTAPDGWSPFFPVTPTALRNRALRMREVNPHRYVNPSPATRHFISEVVDKIPGYEIAMDDLGVSVCDGEVLLGWVGSTRRAFFGPREIAVLDALVPSLKARMLLEHQLGLGGASRALLEAALEAIPTATFIVARSSIDHANAIGRILLERERTATVDRLRESMRTSSPDAPFAITPVEWPGAHPMALAVLRGGRSDGGEVDRRLAAFSVRNRLTPRQGEVLALLARGYANKTIAERFGVAEATVEEHVTLLLRKASVDSRATLVAKFWMD
jgi:DNA-binding CsgD family transcriptional regulator